MADSISASNYEFVLNDSNAHIEASFAELRPEVEIVRIFDENSGA